MGQEQKSKKVSRSIKFGARPRFGGDPLVDRNGISTENHMEIYRRLVKDGPRMHGTPGAPKPRKQS